MRGSLRVGLIATVAAGAVIAQGTARAAAPPGARDLTFGTHGTALLPQSPHDTTHRPPQALTLALRSGRIWVGGAQGEQDYAMRLTSTGHADASFRSGKPYFRIGSGGFVEDDLVLPTPDGGAYVMTSIGDEGGPDYVLTRLTKTGSLDTSWGSHGHASVPLGCPECQGYVLAGTVLPSGGLRFAGALDVDPGGAQQTPVVLGLTASGAPDPTVGPGGQTRIASAPVASAGSLRAATFDPTGRAYFLYARVFAPGCSTLCASQPKVVRTSANGILDAAWGAGGTAEIPLSGNAVSGTGPATSGTALRTSLGTTALLASASGELYVGFDERITGIGTIKAGLAHVRPSGRLDPAFGAAGLAHYSAVGGNGSISAIASDGAGHLILGLTYSTAKTYAHLLLRVSASTGAVSTGFGHNGAVASPVHVLAMARQSAHALVVLGWPTSGRTNRPSQGSELVRYAI